MNDVLFDEMTRTARELGSYQAIAEMFADAVADLQKAEANNEEWLKTFSMGRLDSLCHQLKDVQEKYKKEVDIA